MIHLNKGKNDHEWLTKEQFEGEYPELAKIVNTQYETLEGLKYGGHLKTLRVKSRITIREMSDHLAIGMSDLCDCEKNANKFTYAQIDKYVTFCQNK